jgi:hypothetical protein
MGAAGEMAIGKAAGGEAARMAEAKKTDMRGGGWGEGVLKAAGSEAARMALGSRLCIAAAGEMAVGRRQAARWIEWRGRLGRDLHGGGWEMAIEKAAGGDADRMAAAEKAAMHGCGWGDGDWEGAGRRGE